MSRFKWFQEQWHNLPRKEKENKMGNQAVVSVISEGKVIIKVVAGCGGYNAETFAEYLKKSLLKANLDIREIYDLASRYSLGSKENLVVLTEDGVYHETNEELNPRYRETFHLANLNPRLKQETSDLIIIIGIDKE
jgi:hypothetical protein